MTASSNRELIFGLISPIGVDRDHVISALRNEFSKVSYSVERVHVSDQLRAFAKPFDEHDYVGAKNALMDAGNRMREWHKGGDAAALLCMLEIGKLRRKRGFSRNILTSHTYVVDSLKHPDEIERFQATYGPAFVGIGLYEPPELRRQRMNDSATTLLTKPDLSAIDALILRDEDEGLEFGQKVREAFELADFIVDVSAPPQRIDAQIWRLVRCLFGDVQETPTLHEYGMALARAAQAKSGSLARQVGAAVMHVDGSILAVGTNEVARPGGGQYTAADDAAYPYGRDVNRGKDSSDFYRRKAVIDLLDRLQKAGELAARNRRTDPQELFNRWWYSDDPWLRKAFQNSTIDYVRAVHAEMSTIADAARNGANLKGCRMYTTTFPCHDCAKHIVDAGLCEVVYLAPYPKSLVAELYGDSIQINVQTPLKGKVHFHSFVGVAPRRYDDFFLIGKRDRKRDGRPIEFDASKAVLSLPSNTPDPKSVIVSETDAAKAFAEKYKRYLTGRSRHRPNSRASRSR